MRAGELQRDRHGDSLTRWSGVLAVCFTFTNSFGPTIEDAGGGLRVIDCVPRREEATAPLLER